jgi:hypothetical protein
LEKLYPKFVLISLIVMALGFGISNVSALEPKHCVTVGTENYYARGIHDDFIARDIQVCLSHTTKSIAYELPPLTVPLVLESTDGATMTVVVAPIDDLDNSVIHEIGESIEIVLPQPDVRYQMNVSVAASSDGIIEGLIGGEVIGRILLLDFHDTSSDTLIVALGGLSTEWQFRATHRPDYSLVRFGLITTPTETGEFELADDRWLRISRSEFLVILGDEWLEGGYFAIKTVFPK